MMKRGTKYKIGCGKKYACKGLSRVARGVYSKPRESKYVIIYRCEIINSINVNAVTVSLVCVCELLVLNTKTKEEEGYRRLISGIWTN